MLKCCIKGYLRHVSNCHSLRSFIGLAVALCLWRHVLLTCDHPGGHSQDSEVDVPSPCEMLQSIRMRFLFPNQACLRGSCSPERISVRIPRDGGSPVTLDRFPQRSWYHDLGAHLFAVKMYPSFSQQKCPHVFAAKHVQFVCSKTYHFGIDILLPRSQVKDPGPKDPELRGP